MTTPETLDRQCSDPRPHPAHNWAAGIYVWRCRGSAQPPTDPSILDGATTLPNEGSEKVDPGEFAALWNQWDDHRRTEVLIAIRDMGETAVACVTEDHASLALALATMSTLHELATARSADLRIALEQIVETAKRYGYGGPKLDEAIEHAREVLVSMPTPLDRDNPEKLRAVLADLLDAEPESRAGWEARTAAREVLGR